jgi:hypothetical protein
MGLMVELRLHGVVSRKRVQAHVTSKLDYSNDGSRM